GAPGVEASARSLAARVEDSVARAERRREPLAPGERIDPSTASADELDRLPKVGPALAARIVEWRQAHGAFRTLADLDSVPGVGPALLRDAGPYLALAPAPAGATVRNPSQTSASVTDSENSLERRTDAPPPPGDAVDINTAPAEELAGLPGIGPALARRIVEWRGAHGPFRDIDALEEVPGIGPATVARVRPLVRATP
ncbi:MAG TPA: helix-hairpin-helix domain-containing protein, partial [Longimicrobium sp.]|nr:helix-hairpin-helix domain-containing protein [Longimicrobium sp.]